MLAWWTDELGHCHIFHDRLGMPDDGVDLFLYLVAATEFVGLPAVRRGSVRDGGFCLLRPGGNACAVAGAIWRSGPLGAVFAVGGHCVAGRICVAIPARGPAMVVVERLRSTHGRGSAQFYDGAGS